MQKWQKNGPMKCITWTKLFVVYHNLDGGKSDWVKKRRNKRKPQSATKIELWIQFWFGAAVIFSHVLAMWITIASYSIIATTTTTTRTYKNKLVHRSGRKIMSYLFIVSVCGSIGSKRMAEAKLQLLLYEFVVFFCCVFFFISFFSSVVVAIRALSNKNAHASLFLSQSKKLIRRCLVCNEAYLRFFLSFSFTLLLLYFLCVCVTVCLQKLPSFFCLLTNYFLI